jgi:tRNA threonylcarbamoyladenosine biosynthesis protein TsaB
LAIILSIETATTNCSVSLSKEGETFALIEDYNNNYSHAERLHVFIEKILKDNNVYKSELSAIAVSKGPGSYTGLRIGVSAAKGLCFALDIPLISIPTLESLTHQVSTESGFIIPMLDARRMEVYSAVFDSKYNIIRTTEAEILTPDIYNNYLNQAQVYFIGNGVEKLKTIIENPKAVFIENKLPSANEMGALAHAKYKISDTEDVAYFEPYYLKDFIALKPKSK